ncbi:MAG: DUF3160 domain-containing protein [Myxococcota bacterium]
MTDPRRPWPAPRGGNVSYPFNGSLVLCRGAVLPYHELINRERLDDREWRHLLDTEQRPSSPEWLKPFVGTNVVTVPPHGP